MSDSQYAALNRYLSINEEENVIFLSNKVLYSISILPKHKCANHFYVETRVEITILTFSNTVDISLIRQRVQEYRCESDIQLYKLRLYSPFNHFNVDFLG